MSRGEVRRALRIVVEQQELLLARWEEIRWSSLLTPKSTPSSPEAMRRAGMSRVPPRRAMTVSAIASSSN
jgi:hypothetical protein